MCNIYSKNKNVNAGRLLAVYAFLTMCFIATTNPLFAVTACPDCTVAVVQPDGTVLAIMPYGDERTGRFVTEDGFTVVKSGDGWYRYALVNDAGKLIASEYKASSEGFRTDEEKTFLNQVGKHAVATNLDLYPKLQLNTKPLYVPALKNGEVTTLNVLVLLINFPDDANVYSTSSFDALMNQDNFDGFGSVNNYYSENSYGAVNISGTSLGWYTASNNRDYYAYNKGWAVAAELAREAVDAAITAGVDFSPYDNDGDGYVDGLFIVHAGPGAEAGYPDYPWSHKWSLSAGGVGLVSTSGVIVNSYNMEPEKLNASRMITIGVFCHEFAHQLGLPDLYDYTGQSEGIGDWGLMGGGNWLGPVDAKGSCPSHFCAWSKTKLGWLQPTNITADLTNRPIGDIENNANCYRLWTQGAPGDEYFLVENRQQILFDSYLPGCGLAIWHIDDSKLRNGNNDDKNHKLVDLEEADGLAEMDLNGNRGDNADLFAAGGGNSLFESSTNPNSDSYSGNGTSVLIELWSGCNTTMYADLKVGNTQAFEIMIRDCLLDIGNEPDIECAGDWVRSPDIWIDNTFDGIINLPAPGLVNMIYFRAENIGSNTVDGAKLSAQFVAPTMGLYFPNPYAADMTDSYTGATDFSFSSILSGGSENVFINWLIPQPPPSIDHYCIGAMLSAPNDPLIDIHPLDDNNIAQINMWALYQKAGQIAPLQTRLNEYATKVDDSVTLFHSQIRAFNTLGGAAYFRPVLDSDLIAGWTAYLQDTSDVLIPVDSYHVMDIYMEALNAQHNDSADVRIQLVLAVNPAIVIGEVTLSYVIDSYRPQAVDSLKATALDCPPDYLDLCPQVRLDWITPLVDEIGETERIRWWYIFRDSMPDKDPNYIVHIYDSVAVDADADIPGFQYHDFEALSPGEQRYYRVASVDGAFSMSAQSNAAFVEGAGPTYVRGDANGDEGVNIGDAVFLINYVFKGGPPPDPVEAGDANCDEGVNIGDAVFLINYVFKGGPSPVAACL